MSVFKNTNRIYDFYCETLSQPWSLAGKDVLLLELGNVRYVHEVKKHAKSVRVVDSACNCFSGDYFEGIDKLKRQVGEYLEGKTMEKFDIDIMNPPYDGDLHLKILTVVMPYAGKVVNISPTCWYAFHIVNTKFYNLSNKNYWQVARNCVYWIL